MQLKSHSIQDKPIQDKPTQTPHQEVFNETISETIDYTSKEILFIMRFGHYFPGFSPEWELFR